jgi:hypothetical protein
MSAARGRKMTARIGFQTKVAIRRGICFMSPRNEFVSFPTSMAPFCITCQWNIAEISVAIKAPMPRARMLPWSSHTWRAESAASEPSGIASTTIAHASLRGFTSSACCCHAEKIPAVSRTYTASTTPKCSRACKGLCHRAAMQATARQIAVISAAFQFQ